MLILEPVYIVDLIRQFKIGAQYLYTKYELTLVGRALTNRILRQTGRGAFLLSHKNELLNLS